MPVSRLSWGTSGNMGRHIPKTEEDGGASTGPEAALSSTGDLLMNSPILTLDAKGTGVLP